MSGYHSYQHRNQKPGAAKVQVSDTHGDSLEAGQARVRLKLGALAYVNSQIGIDANLDLSALALEVLAESAVRYWEVLTKQKFEARIDIGMAGPIRVAALAYVNARHGVDATQEIAQAGMHMLCQASIAFVESLLPKAR